jgi:hypothetical protein
MLETIFYTTLINLCLVYFIIAFCEKQKIFDKIQMKVKSKLIHKLLNCNFCLSFWINSLIMFVWIFKNTDFFLLYFTVPGLNSILWSLKK